MHDLQEVARQFGVYGYAIQTDLFRAPALDLSALLSVGHASQFDPAVKSQPLEIRGNDGGLRGEPILIKVIDLSLGYGNFLVQTAQGLDRSGLLLQLLPE